MSNKYSRHQSIIDRQSDESIGDDHWLKQFKKSLEKGAVQSKNTDSSLYDQINSIMNNKSKYKSVDAAVEDMKERSGLTAYLLKINKTSETDSVSSNKKSASSDSDNNKVIDKNIEMTPIVIKKFPQIEKTLQNYIKDSKGNLSIPAIIEKIRSIHKSDVSDSKDWEDDKLIRFVSRLNLQAKVDNPYSYDNYNNLGRRDVDSNSEVDSANTDAFVGLMPTKL